VLVYKPGDGHSPTAEEHEYVTALLQYETDGYCNDAGGGFGSGYINGYYIGNGHGDGEHGYGTSNGDNYSEES